jgi:hypothetical protein
MAPKTIPAPARAEAAPSAAPEPAPEPTSGGLVRYRILPKGAGLIYTGACDPVTGQAHTFARGEVVEAAPVEAAAVLEERGLVEVLG